METFSPHKKAYRILLEQGIISSKGHSFYNSNQWRIYKQSLKDSIREIGKPGRFDFVSREKISILLDEIGYANYSIARTIDNEKLPDIYRRIDEFFVSKTGNPSPYLVRRCIARVFAPRAGEFTSAGINFLYLASSKYSGPSMIQKFNKNKEVTIDVFPEIKVDLDEMVKIDDLPYSYDNQVRLLEISNRISEKIRLSISDLQ